MNKLPNNLSNMKVFIKNTGVYCSTLDDAKYILDLLDIFKHINKAAWNSQKKEGSPKRKLLLCVGDDNWKFVYCPKVDRKDHTSVSDVKKWVKELVSPTSNLEYSPQHVTNVVPYTRWR